MKQIHVMVDTETLGLSQNALLLSVGAQVFNPLVGYAGFPSFYQEIDALSYPGEVDISTLQFWFSHTKETGKIPPIYGTTPAAAVARDFLYWLIDLKEGKPDELVIWANGTDFDIPKLQRLMDRKEPWKYNSVRDYRTILKLFSSPDSPKFKGENAHNALADCEFQISQLVPIFQNLRAKGVPLCL